jgi:hypothetical protein
MMSKPACPCLPILARALAASEYPRGAGSCVTCPREDACIALAEQARKIEEKERGNING